MTRWSLLLVLPFVACFSPDDPPQDGTEGGSSSGGGSSSASTDPTGSTTGPATGSTGTPSTTSAPMTGSTTSSETTASTGDTTTGTVDDSSTTAAAECGNGAAESGELCFGEPLAVPTVNPVFAIALGDMDGNGSLDLVTSEGQDSEAAFYFGTGTGMFGGYSGEAFSPESVDVATGHFTLNDDDIDAVWALDSDNSMVGVLLSDGAGTFSIPLDTYGSGASGAAVATGDIDGDGLDDIVSVGSESTTQDSQISTWFSANDGAMGVPVSATHPDGVYTDVVIAEFTGNDSLDVAFLYRANATSRLRVCRGNGSGLFSSNLCETYEAGSNALKLGAGDFDGDGNVDLIATQAAGSNVGIFAGQGNGTFAAPMLLDVGEASLGVATGDLDNDGIDDAVVTLVSGDAVVVRGGAAPEIATTLSFEGAQSCQPLDVALGDFNADGALGHRHAVQPEPRRRGSDHRVRHRRLIGVTQPPGASDRSGRARIRRGSRAGPPSPLRWPAARPCPRAPSLRRPRR